MFEKPFIVRFWEEHPGTPRCCHTCASFLNGDIPCCMRHGNWPMTEEDASTCDICPDWRDREGGMPF
jgi:hypothetical protein